VGPKKITSDLSRNLKEYCSSQPAENYWRGKHRISDNFKHVDWEAIGGAMQQSHKARATVQCPRCNDDETPEHVLRCRGFVTPLIGTGHLGS
jgi:hypothetical protein